MFFRYIIYMPSRNTVKPYIENGLYHVYNRSINGSTILLEERDFISFAALLAKYLKTPAHSYTTATRKRHKNYNNRIELLAFCLMHNHFHLLLQQKDPQDMAEFMQSLQISLTSILNRKYHRTGPVLQGVYRARPIFSDADLVNVSKYIHLNPNDSNKFDLKLLLQHIYSSLGCYIGNQMMHWSFVHTHTILRLFNNSPQQYAEYLRQD